MSVSKHLQDKLALLPDSPGCYIMKDENQNILYVGKAKVLKNRVRSYFHGTHNNKTTRLVSHIRDFEFIVTGSEKEALLLEINLIKKHTPPYNIMFMDDKTYPYIEITKENNFVVRIPQNQPHDILLTVYVTWYFLIPHSHLFASILEQM